MSRLDPEKLWSEISPESRARLWVCEHFKILPTDPKYRSLTDLQASLLFTNWLHTPEEGDVKESYWTQKAMETKAIPAHDDLRALGYDDEQIEEILKEIAG